MKKYVNILLIVIGSISLLYPQTGGGKGSVIKAINNISIMVGMNQSFYNKEWNEQIDKINDNMEIMYGGQSKLTNARFPNITIINEFDEDVLAGLKYSQYGFKFESSYPNTEENNYTSQDNKYEFESTFFKIFITYPIGNGVYLGIEGGYFIEAYLRWENVMIEDDGFVDKYVSEDTIELDMWTEDLEFSEFDYGLLIQYFYGISPKLLATIEGYYGLSKFNEDLDYEISPVFLPNTFHYLSLGLTYKIGG